MTIKIVIVKNPIISWIQTHEGHVRLLSIDTVVFVQKRKNGKLCYETLCL